MADRLLKTSDSPVLEIAAQCGFDNLSYFNRIFKRKYGVSPGKCGSQPGKAYFRILSYVFNASCTALSNMLYYRCKKNNRQSG